MNITFITKCLYELSIPSLKRLRKILYFGNIITNDVILNHRSLLNLCYTSLSDITYSLIDNNDIHFLESFHRHGIDFLSQHYLYYSIKHNKFTFVKFFINKVQRECDDDYYTKEAAKNNNYEMVKFLCENGYSLGKRTIKHAVINENAEIIEYIIANLLKQENNNIVDVLKIAITHKKVNVVKHICEYKESLWKRTDLTDLAASVGSIEILKILKSKGLRLCGIDIIRAVQNGHIETVKFLRKKGIEWFEGAFLFALKNNDITFVKELCKIDIPIPIRDPILLYVCATPKLIFWLTRKHYIPKELCIEYLNKHFFLNY